MNVEYGNTKQGVTVNETKGVLGYGAAVDLAVKMAGRFYLETGAGVISRNFDVRTTISSQVITSRNSSRLYFAPLQLRLYAGRFLLGGGGYYGRYATGAPAGFKKTTYGYIASLAFFLTPDSPTQKVVGSINAFFKNKLSSRWLIEARFMKDAVDQAVDPSETLRFSQFFVGLGIVF